jgi:hypothetical protein
MSTGVLCTLCPYPLSFIGALAGYIRPLDDTPVGKSDVVRIADELSTLSPAHADQLASQECSSLTPLALDSPTPVQRGYGHMQRARESNGNYLVAPHLDTLAASGVNARLKISRQFAARLTLWAVGYVASNTDAAAVEMTNDQNFKLRIIHASCQNKRANEGGEAEHADADPSARRPTDADEHRHQCCPSEHRRHIYSVQPSPDLWLKTVQDSAIGDIADS